MSTSRITDRQIAELQKVVGDDTRSFRPPKEAITRVLKLRGRELKAGWRRLLIELMSEFFILLTDDEAMAWIVKWAKKSKVEAHQIVDGWRKQARARGIADNVMIHAEVLPGCTCKRDIPKLGLCWDDFSYLQGWSFPDEPTEHSLVSWIPAPLRESTSSNVPEQTGLVSAFKTVAALPAWYEISFGSVTHVAGLIHAHSKVMNQDPLNGLIVRTNICGTDGNRLFLDRRGGWLDCGYWRWDEGRYSDVAVFALGVVKALGR